ncbi:MAG TPA: pectin acetylesterase-family hydrolase, partial [Actinomycetes bacterium]|nr:pectin acetylesterase-family hydrolase [Actinomycetes bacterium]
AGDPGSAAAGSGAWQRIEPGGRTRCGRGGSFAFWARMGAPDRLLVFFEGGGGCWDYRSCAAGTAMFDDDVDLSDDPSRGAGVLDLDDPRNPFRRWSVLFVPSCGGDVFAGDAVRTYRAADGRTVTVHHRGHVNATAALEWMFERVPDPRRVFVAGCSAGSIGSILHAPRILRQYPEAQVAQLGDSLGYLFSQPTDLRELWGADRVLPDWVPGVRAIPRARFTMPRFYRAVAGHYPRASFAQVNFADDSVQRRFHEAAGGAPEAFGQALLGNLAAIRAGTPNFRSCLLEGSAHCALPSPAFYSLTSGGVSLRDWVAAQANGEPVANLPPGS